MRSRLVANSITGVALNAANVVVAFVMSPILVRELGNRNYGIWDIMLALIGYLGILDLGVSPAIVRYVAVASARDDESHLVRVFHSSLLFLSGVGVLGLLIMSGLSFFAGPVLNVEPAAAGELPALFVLVGLNLLIEFPGATLVGFLMGLQRHSFVNVLRIFVTVASAFALYLALTRASGPKLLWLGGIVLASNVAQYLALAAWIAAAYPRIAFRRRGVSVATMRDLFAFGVRSMLLMAASRIRKQSIPIVIAHCVGLGRVVFFAIPNRLVESAWGLGATLGFPVTPYLAALHGKGDEAGTRRAWFELTRALQIFLLAIPIGLVALGEPFIRRWMGPSYALEARWVIVLLSLSVFMEGLAPNAVSVLVGMGRHGAAARVSLAWGAGSLLLAVPMALAWDIRGVAVSVVVASAGTTFSVLRLACREVGISLREHMTGTALRLVVPLAVLGGVLGALRWTREPASYSAMILHAAAAAVAYLVAVWFGGFDREERGTILEWVRAGAARIARRPASESGSGTEPRSR